MNTDFTFQNEGTLVILFAVSNAAQEWIENHLPIEHIVWGQAGHVIEWRFFPAILEGIQNDGLTIKEI